MLAALLLYFLYIFGLNATGLVGPDEPRYASIGREMAISGDWVTPRLWGEPWFEKPPLLYWMAGAAWRAGLRGDRGPRLPVAWLSIAFLVFFWWILRREFSAAVANFATVILATCAGWLVYSQVCATDLPMAAPFAAGMLLCLPWLRGGERRLLPLAGACFGLAVLGKGLVPVALAAPLVLFVLPRWRQWRDWVLPKCAFFLVAVPWYALCTLYNGRAFIDSFFLKHHFARFANDSLQHVQPFWFYVPVLLAGLLPWTPLVALAFRRANWSEPRRRLLALWFVWGLVFFSASTNKLPGYLLPLLPALAILMALGLAESRHPQRWLAASVALIGLMPLVVRVLPQALQMGLSRADVDLRLLLWGSPAVLAAILILWLDPGKALACAAALVSLAFLYAKIGALNEIDRSASARPLWRQIEPRRDQVCVDEIHRAWRYGLNYYSVTPLPSCSAEPRPLRVTQKPGERPALVESRD